jgi:hypothetical protein
LTTEPQGEFESRLLKAERGDSDNDIYTFSLPFFAGFALFTDPARNHRRPIGRDNGKEKTTHSLSPSSLGLNLSSQTQLKYKRGFPAISIKAHSLSPSSLGLTLFTDPAAENHEPEGL